MSEYHVTIRSRESANAKPFDIEALDIATALTIADINVRQGTAEIWNGKHCLARLVKRGGGGTTYWELM